MEVESRHQLVLNTETLNRYLYLITEASMKLNNNSGALRKNLWDYLKEKH